MIQAFKNKVPTIKNDKFKNNIDILVTRIEEIQEFDEYGNKIFKKKVIVTNLTKKINETAKIVKQNAVSTAEQKLAEMEKIFSQN